MAAAAPRAYPEPPQSSPVAAGPQTPASGVPGVFANLTDEHFANDAALIEAWEQYGDDADRELADLEAGRHPLQRPHA